MSKIVNDLVEAKLFELMEKSPFEELSTDEREFVKNYFSKEEYKNQRAVMVDLEVFESVSQSQNDFPSLDPPVVDLSSKSDSKIKQLFSFKVPAYAVAMALILAIIIPQILKNKSVVISDNIVGADLIQAPKHTKDSIVVEPEEQFVKEEKAPISITDSLYIVQMKKNIEIQLNKPKGRNILNDPFIVFYRPM